MELLERSSFLRTLAEYAREARMGDGRLVLVSGESGIGKTALLEAFQGDLSGARWLWGACDGLLTPRPLGPLFDIGGQLDGELASLCRDGAPRDRLFSSFLAELDSRPAFTVAVVEDTHWADEATIDLLSFVGRRLARLPAMVLVTYRDEELGDDHPLRLVLGDLATQRATRRMKLPPLSEDAVRTLAGARGVDASELHRVTGGNPFYVSEILDAGWPSIPPTVRDAVAARLVRLDAEARSVAEAAAVSGARVPRSMLSALAGQEEPIDECLAAGLLIADGSDVRFRHELVRMAVEARIPAHRRRALHARLLEALHADGGTDAALLAHHADGAGDGLAVLRHAPEAARLSSALGAHRESAAQYERALHHADSLDAADLAGLYEGIAGEYRLLDRWEEAEAALRVALGLRRQLGDDLNVGTDLRLLSPTLWRLCRGEESEQAAQESVRVLSRLPAGPELAWAYARVAACLLNFGRLDEAITFIEKCRELGEHLNQSDVIAEAMSMKGSLLIERGEDGLALLERAHELVIAEGVPDEIGRGYTNLHEGAMALHRFDDADRFYADGMSYCEDRELGVFTMCLLGWRAHGLLLRGRWDEAASTCSRELGLLGISPVNQLNPLRVLGTIRARRGEAGPEELLDKAVRLAIGTGEHQWIVPARAARAELRWLCGRPELAIDEVRSALADVSGFLEPWTLGSLSIWLTRLDPTSSQPEELPEPYALEASGDARAAAEAWDRLGRPYDAALARLFSSEEADLRQALAALESLGATATATAARRRMKELGIGAIPRGPRPATRSAPAGLTAREQQILALLAEGLQDKEISRRLVISERTVHHHVSAVLSKIGASTRAAAVSEAARLGIGSPA